MTGIPATPHSFRHAMASAMLNNDAPITLIQDLLGHANVSTTQIYTHLTDPQLKQVHDRFHSSGD